jgi:IclR family pca regulon transcriptional regulator
LFPAQLPILTTKSLSTREDLLREIQRVREYGYAVCKGAWHLDVAGVAAAIPGANGRTAAAVSVALPRQRLTAARQTALAAALMRTTQAIASQLDGRTQAASLPPATPPSTRRR